MKVLIADDSDAVLRRLAVLLAAVEGVEIVGCARDGLETLELVQEKQPEVLILDLHLPRLSGFGVLEALRRRHGTARVLVLTSHPFPQYRELCHALGAEFFDKDGDFERVATLLGRWAFDTPSQNDEELNASRPSARARKKGLPRG